jgi:hypothetical protein
VIRVSEKKQQQNEEEEEKKAEYRFGDGVSNAHKRAVDTLHHISGSSDGTTGCDELVV